MTRRRKYYESHHAIVLPNLEKLSIGRLPQLRCIWSGPSYHVKLPSLTDVEVRECKSLIYLFTLSVAQSLVQLKSLENLRILRIGSWNQMNFLSGLKDGFFKNLEELSINRCGVKVLFPLEDGDQHLFSLPNLKTLELEYLPELEGLCSKSPTLVLSLENLTTLYLDHCDRLRNIFSPSLAQNLLQLQVLMIYDCGELEEIIVEEDEENQILIFQNLLEIDVVRCPKIRRLFAITVAPCLQKLKEIRVYDNSELEEVFGDKDVADVMDHKEIVLPQLDDLYLEELPSLSKFCPDLEMEKGGSYLYQKREREWRIKMEDDGGTVGEKWKERVKPNTMPRWIIVSDMAGDRVDLITNYSGLVSTRSMGDYQAADQASSAVGGYKPTGMAPSSSSSIRIIN
ncbi:hypothetical protein Patl1_04188 [Pistacia atlantica]|uniref:Uncharacterized protein n=1 Tax=Pistacia atlantica TaxID=434234 RepID=A0ACC1BVX2_9ROSI|nr:hypothetical protein Patl1_04188 [Pistacia atlantica]